MSENDKSFSAETLAGKAKTDKVFDARAFPVNSLEGVLEQIRRTAGTGKLEIHFRNGHARGEAKWEGFSKDKS
jgi:hypothetical protein